MGLHAASAQIDNAGFEEWLMGIPVGWSAPNNLGGSVLPITQSTDAHSGLFAVHGEVKLLGMPFPPKLQKNDQAMTETPAAFSGWYQFGRLGQFDEIRISVTIYDALDAVVAAGNLAITEPQLGGYASFTVPLVPGDSPFAAARASFSFDIGNSDVAVPYVGSWYLLDDLSFEDLSGVPMQVLPAAHLGLPYPQPASDRVSLPLELPSSARVMMQVFDLQGRLVDEIDQGVLPAGSHTLGWSATNAFSESTYVVRVAAEGHAPAWRTVTVVH